MGSARVVGTVQALASFYVAWQLHQLELVGAVCSYPYSEGGGNPHVLDGRDQLCFPSGTGAGLRKGTNTVQPFIPVGASVLF